MAELITEEFKRVFADVSDFEASNRETAPESKVDLGGAGGAMLADGGAGVTGATFAGAN